MTCVNTFLKMRKIKFLGIVHTRKLQNDDTIVDKEKYVIAQVTQAHQCKYLFFGHRSLIRNNTQTAVIDIRKKRLVQKNFTWRFVCSNKHLISSNRVKMVVAYYQSKRFVWEFTGRPSSRAYIVVAYHRILRVCMMILVIAAHGRR